MSKNVTNTNRIIDLIIQKRNEAGETITPDDVKKIKNFILEDIKKADKTLLSFIITDYLQQLCFTGEEIKSIIPNITINPLTDTIVGKTAMEASELISNFYDALEKANFIMLPLKENPVNYEAFCKFVKVYWQGDIAINAISGDIEFINMPELENHLNGNSELMKNNVRIDIFNDTTFYFMSAQYKGVTRELISSYLVTYASNNIYNPVIKMLESEKWDGIDRLPLVYRYLQQEDSFKKMLIRKWLIQCVAMLFNDGTVGAEGCLTLCGSQGTGKTAFFQKIVPEISWMRSIDSFDPRDKDKVIKATHAWIGELSEVEDMYKKDQGALKSFLTEMTDVYRVPYGKAETKHARITSYGATVNKIDFLADDASRRWWVIEMNDYNTPEQIKELHDNAKQLWLQVYNIYMLNKEAFRLTAEERDQVIMNNENYSREMPFEEVLKRLYNFDKQGAEFVRFQDMWKLVCPEEQVEFCDQHFKRECFKTIKRLCSIHKIKMVTIHHYDGCYIDLRADEESPF